jgi:hypothetical protein
MAKGLSPNHSRIDRRHAHPDRRHRTPVGGNLQVDVEPRIVQPGASFGNVDMECQAFGLSVPVEINSTTEIAGLTLGGSFGWTTRKCSMTPTTSSASTKISRRPHS